MPKKNSKPKMVEKKSYQTHHRNISGLSEISIQLDPIKREDGNEIKVIFLLDSWTERNCMFDLIHRYLQDGQSDIVEPSLLNHHWEQPHRDCLGPECIHCIKISHPPTHNKGHDRRASEDNALSNFVVQNKLKSRHDSYGSSLSPSSNEGYFRFFIDGCPFRLMLLSKDKQNLLKIVSFDFLVVCMQVQRKPGETETSLDENIWEFEWKRLEKHSMKILAPIILLGYFRDILKLGQIGHGEDPLDKIILDSKLSLQKTCRKYRAIPRFCDFVTGSSMELYNLFFDLSKLFHETGYILQQCALANNIQHFKMVMHSVSYKEEDLLFQDPDTGDNPVMIAAQLRHKDLVSDVLRSPRFSRIDDCDFLEKFIHSRNKNDQTLLHMVAIQGPELEEQKLLILRKEIEIHCVAEEKDEDIHVANQLKLQRCLRDQLKSSSEAAIINEQCRALQGIPRTTRELKAEKGKVWSRLFFSTLFLSLIFNAIDTGSDILIMIRYFNELIGDQEPDANTCNTDVNTGGYQIAENNTYTKINCTDNWQSGDNIKITCFPITMDPKSKFGYTLFFILVPWPFFIYEFFTSRHYENMKNKFKELIDEMSQCNGFKSILFSYLRLIIHTVQFVSCVAFWPIAVLFIKYYEDGKYYLSKGAKKVAREMKIETSEVLYSTARVMEVSLESSFQPTIQLYLLFPTLVQQVEGDKFVFQVFTVCKAGKIPVIKPDQTISIITSILSLSWCFTAYHATLKRGALDKDLAALFYRAVLFLSVLFQILGRLFILVLFAYSFGPGRYFPMLIFLGSHILLMSFLHFIFSDAKKYWVTDRGGFLNFLHYMIGNGLANIYIHNWIRMDPLLEPWTKPLQHVDTLVRQFLFDMIFITENIVLLTIALNSNIEELQESRATYVIVLMGFQLVGLILKCVYYRYLHLWAWLIMNYTTKKEDGHWKCTLISDMYFCGEKRKRELLLCCIPRPFFNCLSFFFKQRNCAPTGGSCSICGALFSLLLFPLALLLALVGLILTFIVCIAFMPFFIVFFLPCLLVAKCRFERSHHQVVKMSESESKPDNFLLVDTERISLGDIKPDTNCTNL